MSSPKASLPDDILNNLPPKFEYHETSLGTFKIVRVGMTRKLDMLAILAGHLDEDGKLKGNNNDDHLRIWAEVVVKCLVDEDGNFPYDNDQGVNLLMELQENFVQLRDKADRLNIISAKYREKETEAAKNG